MELSREGQQRFVDLTKELAELRGELATAQAAVAEAMGEAQAKAEAQKGKREAWHVRASGLEPAARLLAAMTVVIALLCPVESPPLNAHSRIRPISRSLHSSHA